MSLTIKAPAKINLGLRVLGKRGDGFHDILSIFQTVGLYDELSVESAEMTSLSCNVESVPCDSSNLILKAKTALENESGRSFDLALSLIKRIPMGAGLGGGSTDAATAISAVTEHETLSISDAKLMEIAAQIGSDVPFLMSGGTAVVSGRGERMMPAQWPFDFTYVIVFPGFGISTAWAYCQFKEYPGDNGRYMAMTSRLLEGTLEKDEFFGVLVNDFERVVFPAHAELESIRNRFLDIGAEAGIMTGSGAAMLGIFEDENKAAECEQAMRERYSDVFRVKAV